MRNNSRMGSRRKKSNLRFREGVGASASRQPSPAVVDPPRPPNPPDVSKPDPLPPAPARRPWWRRLGAAFGLWCIETGIGLIPLAAHEISSLLAENAHRPSLPSVQPELCILAVVASGLSIASIFRPFFEREHLNANWLTVLLGFANGLAVVVGTFIYPWVIDPSLADSMQGSMAHLPVGILGTAIAASLFLAVERGLSASR